MDVSRLENERKKELVEAILDKLNDKCQEAANRFQTVREAGPHTRKLAGWIYAKQLFADPQSTIEEAFRFTFEQLDSGKPFWGEEELAEKLMRNRV